MNRRRNVRNQRYGNGLVSFLLIIILAVGFGYATTKHIVPYFIGSSDNNPVINQEDNNFSGSSIVIGQQDVADGNTGVEEKPGSDETGEKNHNTETVTLFCIQYGSFSGKEGAETEIDRLRKANIDTIAIQNDGSYKVIGTPFVQEEEARKALTTMKAIAGEEIFITTMEACMQ